MAAHAVIAVPTLSWGLSASVKRSRKEMSVALASVVGDPVWRLTSSSRGSPPPLSSQSSSSSSSSSSAAAAAGAGAGAGISMGACSSSGGTGLDSGSNPACCNCVSTASAIPATDVYEFICGGPLLRKAGLDSDSVKEGISEWIELGLRLSQFLGFNESMLTETEKTRIYHYYLPVYMWCKKELELHRRRSHEPLVIGISAPQGCGKTTLVAALDYLFNATGSAAASVSIDDFYLTASDQEKLAREHKDNALLELRGNAGSHDLQLGNETIKSLLSLADGSTASVPHYEKSANNGRGDRSDPSTWSKVKGPLQVLLFEGWMLGFKPLDKELVKAVDPQLEIVNENLVEYQDKWFSLVGSWIIVQVEDPAWVYGWRLQAELAMKARGKPGMSDEQVADFVGRYMPAYKAYLQTLYTEGPLGSKPEKILKFSIDQKRNPVA